MKFTLSWLKDHLETEASLDEIVETLTLIGLEVEEVDTRQSLANFTIAHVLEAEQHPNADRLRVLKVDAGLGEPVQVVCGAPNARAGLWGVFAAPGMHIPGTGVDLKIGEIRGVASRGMMCSERELELSDEHDGIIDLQLGDAPPKPGTPYAEWAELDDPVIEIGITPNRPDCLGVSGIARDLAAAGLGTLKDHRPPAFKGTFASPVPITLTLSGDDSHLCSAFYGAYVRGVKNGPSPKWVQQRLRAIGLRPINALVDVTNYVSYDRGRPLHVYDADKITGTICARTGKNGESFEALDGKIYDVDERMCVIADDSHVLGLGGIMGGESSGSQLDTVNVLIECAYFDPNRTAESGRCTGINSDARYRFERGVDPAYLRYGLDLAVQMVTDFCGGEVSEPLYVGEAPERDLIIEFPISEVKRLSGLNPPLPEIKAILEALGFFVSGQGETVRVAVPSWRPDIEGKADLVEEVMRIYGVNKVPSTALAPVDATSATILTSGQIRVRNARRALASRGMMEGITWSFIDQASAEHFGGGTRATELANPISSDMTQMRPSLIPSLMHNAQRNADRGYGDVALFEVGQVYAGDKPDDQSMHATGIRRGTARIEGAGRYWSGTTSTVDVFEAKADALAVLAEIGAPVAKLQVFDGAPGWYHPGRSGTLRLGPKTILAAFGEIHPRTLSALDVSGPMVAFEVYMDALPNPKGKAGKSRGALNASDLQPLKRDFAFVVDEKVDAQSLLRAAMGAEKKLVTDAVLFDIFTGAALGEGKKSMAVQVTLQPREKTLTDEEIEAVAAKIVAQVEKTTGGVLRG